MRGEAEQLGHELREMNKYEDLLDVFISFLIKRSPTVFILINMTLVIWLVQTIYSSRSDSIPRSIYYFSPFFEALPVLNIVIGKKQCNDHLQKVVLKTFPAIKSSHINRNNLTSWDNSSLSFCLEKGSTVGNFSLECTDGQHYCSGFCVDNIKRCPITGIKKIRITDDLPNGTQFLYSTADGLYKYVMSRESKNEFVVGLSAEFEEQCANDFKYYDKYDTFSSYWNQTKQCGDEGRVPSEVYRLFDKIQVKKFLLNNGLWNQQIDELQNVQVSIGTISLIKFNNKTADCIKAEALARQLTNELVEDTAKPTFTQSILIIAFVFFTVGWGWLVGYYCFEGSRKEKNMIVILMCIIELVVICFLYVQNIQMFRTEQLIAKISNCIQTQIVATSHWAFGITNSSPFLSIIYCCTSFLLLQAVANFIDRRVYVAYYAEEGAQNQRMCC